MFLDYNQNAKDRTIAARLLGAADGRTRACRRRSTWDEIDDVRARRLHARDDAGAVRRASAIGTPAIDEHAVLARRAARAVGAAGARGAGRRAVAAALPEAGRASRRASQPSRRRTPKHPLIEIGRAQREGRCARGARALEGAPSRGGRAPRAGRRAGRRDARPLPHLDAHPRQPAARAGASCGRRRRRSIPDDTPDDWSGVTTLAGRAEDLLELVRRRDLELIVAAVARRLVGPPAQEDRRVAERDRPAGGRTSPRRRARSAAAPTTDPCPRSSGSGRRACASSRRRRPPPIRATDARRARARAAARAPRPAALRIAIVNDEVTPT